MSANHPEPTYEQIRRMHEIVRQSAFDKSFEYVTKAGHLIFRLKGWGLVMVHRSGRVVQDTRLG